MGRRKIEIKAIKDDRNRSVTFLKRKGGLFKKAHELSVLCSVDVAVIIFGQNKKLYEFSSGDINQTLSHYQYYGQPHERKGPADFADKGGGDDDEDEDEPMGSPGPQERQSPPHHGVVQHPLQNQPGMQHMRHSSTPSASPPMRNGAFQGHRMSTPQPSSGPRPDSRTHMRRQSSNLVPQNHPHPQATQPMQQSMAYGYQPQAPFYNYNQAAATANMQQQQQQQQNQQQQQQQQQPHQQPPHSTPPTQQHHNLSHPPPNSQMQQLYLQEQRRQSMPSSLASHNRQQMPSMHAPLRPSRPFQSPPLPEPGRAQPPVKFEQEDGNTAERQQQASRQWEPITLAQPVPSDQRPSREESLPRPSSIDVGSAMRYNPDAPESHARYGPPPPPTAPVRPPVRSLSGSTMGAAGPTRVNSLQSDAKRPQLRVQIPGEASDEASSAEEASPKDTSKSTMATPAKPGALEPTHTSGIVLPAPSPRSASAGAVLSAGATGPANPFARPNIPSKQPSNNEWKDGVASPMSALPSRVMGESGYMSSPSSMFPELGFGSMQSNTLASPAIYQPTPINFHGPSFRDEPADRDKDKEKRRKSPDEPDGPNKKAKS